MLRSEILLKGRVIHERLAQDYGATINYQQVKLYLQESRPLRSRRGWASARAQWRVCTDGSAPAVRGRSGCSGPGGLGDMGRRDTGPRRPSDRSDRLALPHRTNPPPRTSTRPSAPSPPTNARTPWTPCPGGPPPPDPMNRDSCAAFAACPTRRARTVRPPLHLLTLSDKRPVSVLGHAARACAEESSTGVGYGARPPSVSLSTGSVQWARELSGRIRVVLSEPFSSCAGG